MRLVNLESSWWDGGTIDYWWDGWGDYRPLVGYRFVYRPTDLVITPTELTGWSFSPFSERFLPDFLEKLKLFRIFFSSCLTSLARTWLLMPTKIHLQEHVLNCAASEIRFADISSDVINKARILCSLSLFDFKLHFCRAFAFYTLYKPNKTENPSKDALCKTDKRLD